MKSKRKNGFTLGVITDEERAWVDENTDKKVFEREVDVYAKIKVKPDPACRFEGKVGLYRKFGVKIGRAHV